MVFVNGLGFVFASPDLWVSLLLGFLPGVLLYYVVFQRISGFDTFEHELTHAIVALLFFRKIIRFVTTGDEGGYVSHSGGFGGQFGDDMIGLAPYYLPTFTLLSALVYPALPRTWFPWFTIWLGATLAYHTLSTLRETAQNWTGSAFRSAGTGEWTLSDIGRRGFFFSAVFIFTFTLIFHSLIFWLISRGYASLSLWTKMLWDTSMAFYAKLFLLVGYWLQKLVTKIC